MGLTKLGPVQKQERFQVVDIVRGFALFGILMVNIQMTGQSSSDLWEPRGSNTVAFFIMETFFSSKFYSMYSLLFGLGMSLQMLRAEGQQVPFVWRYLRRLFWLFVIGGLHALLVWEGDILTLYAILGLVLVLCRKLKPGLLVGIALGLIALQVAAFGPAQQWYSHHTSAVSNYGMGQYQIDLMFRTGTYPQLVEFRLESWFPVWLTQNIAAEGSFGMGLAAFGLFLLQTINIAGFFLLGLAAGKAGVFQDVEGHLRFWRRLFWIAFPIGLVINIGGDAWVNGLYAQANETGLSGWEYQLMYAVYGLMPVLTFGYISGLVLLSRKWKFLRFWAPAGQMALTNYLVQNIFSTWLFFGYGFGLYADIPGMWVILIAVGLYALQLVASNLWLKRFRFGPAEWVWRSLTYWKRQPMRQPNEPDTVPLQG
jgi:uncharacterized protein